jgi:ribonuclease HI
MITIFTDGSSRGNPGPGGWGAVLVIGSENILLASQVIELGGYESDTTNNRMEIMAAIEGLRKASELFGNLPKGSEDPKSAVAVTVFTDSAYVINGITKWVKDWQAKGWMTLQKKPVVNRDLWEKLLAAAAAKEISGKISWKQVGGHVGTVGNERCDEIATMFADKNDPQLFSGPFSDYKIKNILDISVDHDAAAKKSAAKERSNAKAYSYVSSVGGIVQTHATWAECGARVKGKNGTRFKKAISPSDEKAIIVEFKKM